MAKNHDQEKLNEIQAKANQEQAEENERFLKSIKIDLVNDKIIAHEEDLKDLIFYNDEMVINGIKQPDNVLKKYKEKYSTYLNRLNSEHGGKIIFHN